MDITDVDDEANRWLLKDDFERFTVNFVMLKLFTIAH